jgi:ferredoxin
MTFIVDFRKSGKKVPWNDRFESLLDLAEENGIDIENACREGVCGTCKIRLLSGEVDMEITDALEDEDLKQNMILACVAKPKSDLVVEA